MTTLEDAYRTHRENMDNPPPPPPVDAPVAMDDALGESSAAGETLGTATMDDALEFGRATASVGVGGVRDAEQNLIELFTDIGDAVREVGIEIPAFDLNNMRFLSGEEVLQGRAGQGFTQNPDGSIRMTQPPTADTRPGTLVLPDPVPAGKGGVEKFGRGVVSFMAPFVATGGLGGATAWGRIVHSAKSGALADMMMNPQGGTLIKMLNDLEKTHDINVAPELLDFLNVSAGAEADALERLRVRALQSVEGTILGGTLDGLIEAFKIVKNNPELRKKAIQTLISDPVKRFKEGKSPFGTPPKNNVYSPEELATARADERQGADIVAERLNVVVPESERVAGGTYKPGLPDGRTASDLSPEELAVRGEGFKGNDIDLERLWNESVAEVSAAAKNAVERTGATWSAFKAAAWDKALKLPRRAQLWYELSAEKFKRNLPELSDDEFSMFLDLIGATSARAKPGENLERALAILSQKIRGVSVDVDITIPSTVSDALKRGGQDVSSDLANKTGMFSDTLALTAGIPVRYPISVNDIWVGKAFGISDDMLSQNQSLHEVFAKYMNKMRDYVNAGGADEIPHQSWHLQARQWVEMRAADNNIDTGKGLEIEGSDYAGEWGKVVDKLEVAGIEVPDGIITRDILNHPNFADTLRSTTPAYRDAPKATVEFGTLLTDSGKRGAVLFQTAQELGDKTTQKEYLGILTSSMYDSGRGKPTLWEKTVRAATGKSDKVTRIYSPTMADPYAISGTFEGSVGPNIRVPLKGMTPDEIAYFNSMVGQGLRQKAMAAAEIKRLHLTASAPDGYVATSSVRFDWDGVVPEEMISGFARELGPGFEVSVMRYPDGLSIDINPRFNDAGEAVGPTGDDVDRAIDFVVKNHGAKNPREFNAAFKSEYGKNYVEDAGDGSEYKRIIAETLKGWRDGAETKITKLTGGSVSKSDIRKYLTGKLKQLPVTSKQLPKGVTLSSVRGRASTIRKRVTQRIDHHHEQRRAWQKLGNEVDKKMKDAIPVWETRQKRLLKEPPPDGT